MLLAMPTGFPMLWFVRDVSHGIILPYKRDVGGGWVVVLVREAPDRGPVIVSNASGQLTAEWS